MVEVVLNVFAHHKWNYIKQYEHIFISSFTDQRNVFVILVTIGFENRRNELAQSRHAFLAAIYVHPLNHWLNPIID